MSYVDTCYISWKIQTYKILLCTSICAKSTEQTDDIDSNVTDLSVYRQKTFFSIPVEWCNTHSISVINYVLYIST